MHALSTSQPIAPRRAAARMSRGSRKRALVVGGGAFLLFGAWALIANRAHPIPTMARAGLTQGALSFTSTAFAVLVLEYLYSRSRTPAQKLVVPAMGTPAIVFSIMIGVHALAGTPNIGLTLLPSFISGTIFFLTYTLNLRRIELARVAVEQPSPGT